MKMPLFKTGQTGLYIHWPFCATKCPYCDFNIYLRREHDEREWLSAYLKSIQTHAQLIPDAEIVSIYFGGGTPSLMAPSDVQAIIDETAKNWRVADDVEITLEANPVSTEIEKFKAFRQAGVNRLSLGVQSLYDEALAFLGRLHRSGDVLKAIEIARDTFDRFTFDLIYARPGQSVQDWERELIEAIPYMKGHLSAYQLTIKEGTAFERQVERGDFKPIDDDTMSEFYMLTNDIMEANGMPSYEVSNYGAAGQESRHNLIYWQYQDYIGIGAGAHGRISYGGKKYATEDFKRPSDWISAVEKKGHGAIEHILLSPEEQFCEMLMGRLRLLDPVNLESAALQCGLNDWRTQMDINNMNVLSKEGYLDFDEIKGILKPTREGWLRTDAILPFILKD
jgi:putative oxygen-independent coproporphyrinogen III oxidase